MTISRKGSVGSSEGICIIGSIASTSARPDEKSSISTINLYVKKSGVKGQSGRIHHGEAEDFKMIGRVKEHDSQQIRLLRFLRFLAALIAYPPRLRISVVDFVSRRELTRSLSSAMKAETSSNSR